MTTWKLRDYQRSAFDAADGQSRVIVNMPTGWGKSFLLCVLAASEVLNPEKKVVICVPQRIIAQGFGQKKNIMLPDGKLVEWSVPHNLCDSSTAKVDELTNFLLDPPASSAARRVVLTTHMTLSYALSRLSDDELAEIADETTPIIDEAHHILAAEQTRNALGKQIARILDFGFDLWLATAYFFRGDHLPIISETHLAEFTRIHIPFDEYWKNLKFIQGYSYDFVIYKGTVFQELEHILQTAPPAPTIIYCPPEGHKMLLGNKKKTFVARVQEIACECLNATPWTSFEDALRQKSVIVDLVETEQRSEKIRFVAEHGDCVAAILTVGMFREGADWVQAARVIDLVPTNSDQDRLQRFGRLVRDYPGKSHISYLNFFPLVVEQNEDKRRRQLTKLYAHFHASLVLENAIEPIKVKRRTLPKNGQKDDKDDKGSPKGYFNLLGEFNENQQEKIIQDTYGALLSLQAKKDEAGETATPEEVRTTIISALKENGIRTNLVPLARQVLLLMRRKANVSIKTDDLVDAGFDKVWSTDIFKPMIAYSGGIGGPETLAEIRNVIEDVFERQWQEKYNLIRDLPAPPDTQSSAYWWCTHNRTLKSQGKLTETRVSLLEKISWWTWRISVADRWEEMYTAVFDMPKCPKATTKQYTWVRQQRRLYFKDKLHDDKIRRLEEIPWWTWANLQNNWDTQYARVVSLHAKPDHGTELYNWVRTQQRAYKAGKLSENQIVKLESIEWWLWELRVVSRVDGLPDLLLCIEEGLKNGETKSQVADNWAELAGVGSDQVHKYLRAADPSLRQKWDQLGDLRGKRKQKAPPNCEGKLSRVADENELLKDLRIHIADADDLGVPMDETMLLRQWANFEGLSLKEAQVLAKRLPDDVRSLLNSGLSQ